MYNLKWKEYLTSRWPVLIVIHVGMLLSDLFSVYHTGSWWVMTKGVFPFGTTRHRYISSQYLSIYLYPTRGYDEYIDT
jgi:hypothetical protein